MDDDLESYWEDVRVPWVPPPPDPGEKPEQGIFWVGLFADQALTVEVVGYERQKIACEALNLSEIEVAFPPHTASPTTIYGAGVWTSRVKGDLIFKVAFSRQHTAICGDTLCTNIQITPPWDGSVPAI